jgi:PKD repeat protein
MQAHVLLAALLPLCAAAAQVTVPTNLIGIEGNSSTAYPWNWTQPVTAQYIYDSSNFTSQSIGAPILIQSLRFRANGGGTCTGRVYNNVTVKLSTCPVDYLAVVNTFASNHGPDLATVHVGTVTVSPITTAATPNAFYVDIPLGSPFLYDPNGGDLCVELVHDGTFTGGTSAAMDLLSTTTTTNLGARVWHSTQANAITAQSVQNNMTTALEIVHAPPAGLAAGFQADVTSGTSPLAVNFTDQSFSSAPGGVLTWAWDFDGDNVTDSTAQNPSFVYTTCGDFTVSLTVTDSQHAPSTFTRTAYVSTDSITAGFTYALLAPPNVFQFTDTSTPAATAWAWDFDNDGIVDSTLQNPAATLPLCAAATIKLTATRNCRTDDVTQTTFVSPANLPTLYAADNGLSANATAFFDVNVTNPQGIVICGMDHNCGNTAVGTPFTGTVYVTDGTWVGKDNNIAPWRLSATSSGVAAGNNVPASGPLATPLYLPFGSYGMAIHYNVGVRYTGIGATTTPFTYSNADLTLTLGAARSTLFNGGSFFQIRQWNGTIHYDTASLAGTAGYGYFAPGCAGSLGVTHLVPTSRPQLGQTLSVDLDNLPLSAAIVMTGFSNTTSGFGALPLDLTAFGAPGCFGRVSPDANLFLFGAANAATWSFTIPNSAPFVGQVMFNQALVLDPGFNGLGAVASDAAGFMLGN